MAEKQPRKRIGNLNTIGGVVGEMAKVYREARRGELTTKDAGRFVHMLSQLRAALEAGDIERRIEELEERNSGGIRRPKLEVV